MRLDTKGGGGGRREGAESASATRDSRRAGGCTKAVPWNPGGVRGCHRRTGSPWRPCSRRSWSESSSDRSGRPRLPGPHRVVRGMPRSSSWRAPLLLSGPARLRSPGTGSPSPSSCSGQPAPLAEGRRLQRVSSASSSLFHRKLLCGEQRVPLFSRALWHGGRLTSCPAFRLCPASGHPSRPASPNCRLGSVQHTGPSDMQQPVAQGSRSILPEFAEICEYSERVRLSRSRTLKSRLRESRTLVKIAIFYCQFTRFVKITIFVQSCASWHLLAWLWLGRRWRGEGSVPCR